MPANDYAIVDRKSKTALCRDDRWKPIWKQYREDSKGHLILDPTLNFLCFNDKVHANKNLVLHQVPVPSAEVIKLYGFLCYGDQEERSINGSLR
jgi:hypothetical protein